MSCASGDVTMFCVATTTAHDLSFLSRQNQDAILFFMFVILSLCVRPPLKFSSRLLFNRTQVTSTNHCLKSELNFPHTVFFRFVSAMPLDMLIAHHAGAESHCSSHNSIPPVHSHNGTAPISFTAQTAGITTTALFKQLLLAAVTTT